MPSQPKGSTPVCRRRVRGPLKRTGNYDLVLSKKNRSCESCNETRFAPLLPPSNPSCIFLDCDEERACFRQVTIHEDQVAGQDRRSSHAVAGLRKSQLQVPSQLAVQVIGHQSRILEENVDVAAVANRRGFATAEAGQISREQWSGTAGQAQSR